MLLAILSDTHDHPVALAEALHLLALHRPGYYIHCGDVGGEQMLDQLAGLPAAFVFGNTDFDRVGLARYAKDVGVRCLAEHGEIELAGRRIAVLHGDDFRLRQQLIDGQAYDYILQGHTHVRTDERFGRTRLINPGALHRARPRSVALLDLATDKLQFLIVENR